MSNKIISKDDLLSGKWTPVRNEIWSSSVLSQGAKLCYIAIAAHVYHGDDNCAWPGQKRLGELLCVSSRTIRTYIEELESVGIIFSERQGLNKTNKYYICKPEIEHLKPLWDADRKNTSGQDKKIASGQDRRQTSDKEEVINNKKSNNTKDSFVNSGIDDKKTKLKFESCRRRLDEEQLEIFDMMVGNKYILTGDEQYKPDLDIKTITGKELLRLIKISPEAVKSAYNVTVAKNKKHFNYFAEVFGTKLEELRKVPITNKVCETYVKLIDDYTNKRLPKSELLDKLNIDAEYLGVEPKYLEEQVMLYYNKLKGEDNDC
ncbi:MAG: helix-turn-helix domain-containing protein [Bacteroidetes bacterium]|nr:helix-turn-helix domain-containing protein [Bacteroidota bacterium]